jgi:hypothetical protein
VGARARIPPSTGENPMRIKSSIKAGGVITGD